VTLVGGEERDARPSVLPCALLRRPVTPADLRRSGTCVLASAARLDGRRADAAFSVDTAEHARRLRLGVGALLDCASLETMGNLPVDEPVPLMALAAWERENLCLLEGSVTVDRELITRNVRPVVELHAVTAAGPQLRPLIHRLAPFLRATQCIAVLQARPRKLDDQPWEADAAGIGVWLGVDDTVELVKPDVYRPAAMTAGRWMFSEMIYDTWLNATHQRERSSGLGDRRVRRGSAAPCRPSQGRLLD
jgi:hypothetical protein